MTAVWCLLKKIFLKKKNATVYMGNCDQDKVTTSCNSTRECKDNK